MNLKINTLLTPNNLTLARLGLSAGFFVVVANCKPGGEGHWLFDLAIVVFVLAALSDMVDGYLARRYGMETSIGRMLDPFVDKVMICGSFIFFLGANFVVDGKNVTDVAPWIVTVVAARELLVTTLRGHSESKGQAFPASVAGKVKMFLQSVTVVVVLFTVGHYGKEPSAGNVRLIFLWVMVITTLVSMVGYILKYFSLNRSPNIPESGTTND
ncbi:MAG: CDP-alcohol phosphatidyltransferase family protein [Phycisphaerae bacterium]